MTRRDRRHSGIVPTARESGAVGDRAGAPPGLRTSELAIGDERFVVLSYPVEKGAAGAELTEAETAVALLALRGLSNAEIAHVRGSTARTVANQLASIYRKLGVGSRVELAARLAASSGA